MHNEYQTKIYIIDMFYKYVYNIYYLQFLGHISSVK